MVMWLMKIEGYLSVRLAFGTHYTSVQVIVYSSGCSIRIRLDSSVNNLCIRTTVKMRSPISPSGFSFNRSHRNGDGDGACCGGRRRCADIDGHYIWSTWVVLMLAAVMA